MTLIIINKIITIIIDDIEGLFYQLVYIYIAASRGGKQTYLIL